MRMTSASSSWVLLQVALFTCTTRLSRARKVSFGNLFEEDTNDNNDASGIYMYYDQPLPEGVAFVHTAMFIRSRPVRFQIWRPVDNSDLTFRLIGEKRVVPSRGVGTYDIELSPSEYVFTQSRDRLAIYNEQDRSALAQTLRPSTTIAYYYVEDGSTVGPGLQITFSRRHLQRSRGFSASVMVDTEILVYQQRAAQAALNTPAPTPSPQEPGRPPQAGTLVYLGHSIDRRTGIMAENSKAIFLLDDVIVQDGVITGFYAFIVSLHPVRFQIWRPVDEDEGMYKLIAEHHYMPRTLGTAELPLSSGEFLAVSSGDRLGFTNVESASPIGYTFGDLPGLRTFTGSLPGGQFPYVGQEVNFSPPRLPYDFAAGLSLDLDASRYPEDALKPPPPLPTGIPRDTTVIQPSGNDTITDQMPPTRVQVKQGETQVSSGIASATKQLQDGARRTFILPSLVFSADGHVTSFWASAVMAGSVQFQVWRPRVGERENFELAGSPRVGAPGRVFELVGKMDSTVAPEDVPGLLEVRLRSTGRIKVNQGDMLGFINKQTGSVIGYQFEATTLYHAPPSDNFAVGSTLTFDQLDIPYTFGVTATYIKADTEVNSTTMEDVIASTIQDNISNTPEEMTTKTPGGGSGNQVPVQAAASSNSHRQEFLDFMRNPYVLLTLFLWLLIMTILLFILCCVIFCRKCQDKTAQPQEYTGNGTSRHPAAYMSWGGGMRDNESLEYFNPRIGGGGMGRASGSRGDNAQNNLNALVQNDLDDGKTSAYL